MRQEFPLLGKRILVTRAEKQAAEFSSKIREVGGIPIEVPLLSFCQVADNQDFIRQVRNLQTYDWLIFTSKNGVDFFFRSFHQYYRDQIPLPKLAVVGTKTAEALRRHGFEPDILPDEFHAEGLLEKLKPFIYKNSRVLLARGSLARSLLVQELEKLGALVKDLIVYETVENTSEKKRLIDLLKGKEIDIITFTSPSTVSYFLKMVERTDWREWTKDCVVACIGPITEKAAIDMNLPVHVCPNIYTLDHLIEELSLQMKHQ